MRPYAQLLHAVRLAAGAEENSDEELHMNVFSWRQSSYCQESASCVNVAAGERDTVMLRESEYPEAMLSTTRARLRAFIHAAKAGHFDQVADS